MFVGRSRETRRKPRSYFPRSFTISKKYPGLGENISRVPRGGERGFEGRRGSAQVPDCREGRNRAGGGGARRPEAHRLCSGRARFLLSFASVLPLLRFRAKQILFLNWIEKGAGLHGQTHGLHAFTEQSYEGPAGPGGRAEGRWEAGEGRGPQAGPRAPRDSGRRGGAGRLPFLALPGALLSLFFIAAAPSCLR